MSPAISGSDSPHHPDLNAEVATLSTKLINAINYQTTLDDTLSATRSELEQAREQIKTLEERNATQREMLSGDVWVRKKNVEQEKQKLLGRVAYEKQLREDVEKEKKKIELELENLTAALFEEANKMVVSAKEESRREQDIVHKKNDQLRAQVADTEALLKSQQEQLAELKNVMEQMTIERGELPVVTAPSSPGFARSDSKDDDRPDSAGLAPHSATLEPVSPSHSTSFSHLIHPILRTDLASYEDFTTLARLSRNHAGNRVSSGSFAGAHRLGTGIGGSTSSAHPSNASTASLPNAGNATPSPQSPHTPLSSASHASNDPSTPPPPLKESRYYKRVLTEDVEPTLRLDAAPGLSWLARRSVLSAMAEGNIVVEPIPTNSPYANYVKPQFYACSLCGDARSDERYLRNHRFRTSESESAQRYPLCKFCLNRVRSTCDFLSFLRILKDGHWRTERDDIEKAAWEESVRLREQMFWSRIGGGVVPVGHPVLSDLDKSPRPSHESGRQTDASASSETQPAPPTTITETPATPEESGTPLGGAPLSESADTPIAENSSNSKSESPQAPADDETVEAAATEPNRLSITIPKTDKDKADE